VTCQDATDFLGDYVAGALAPDVLATFTRHLERCPNCREFLGQYEQTIAAGRAACADETLPLPDELVQAILASLKDRT
jgi:anti-sigma factor RsiW